LSGPKKRRPRPPCWRSKAGNQKSRLKPLKQRLKFWRGVVTPPKRNPARLRKCALTPCRRGQGGTTAHGGRPTDGHCPYRKHRSPRPGFPGCNPGLHAGATFSHRRIRRTWRAQAARRNKFSAYVSSSQFHFNWWIDSSPRIGGSIAHLTSKPKNPCMNPW
jgi:hypothetical protein